MPRDVGDVVRGLVQVVLQRGEAGELHHNAAESNEKPNAEQDVGDVATTEGGAEWGGRVWVGWRGCGGGCEAAARCANPPPTPPTHLVARRLAVVCLVGVADGVVEVGSMVWLSGWEVRKRVLVCRRKKTFFDHSPIENLKRRGAIGPAPPQLPLSPRLPVAITQWERVCGEPQPTMLATAANLWHQYLAALSTHPHTVRSATSFILFFVSDAAAQALSSRRSRRARRAPPTTWHWSARFALFGAIIHAPACAAFFEVLDALLPSTSAGTVALKIAADRAFFTPLLLAAAIGWMQLTGGATTTAALRAIGARLPRTWLLSCAVWVPAHAIGFARVPLHLRVLYVNGIALVWNVGLAALAAPPVLPITLPGSPHEK